jgi:hypothetical protein
MKSISKVRLENDARAKRSWVRRLLFLLVGVDVPEKQQYIFECSTDLGEFYQEEVLSAPSACGFSLRDMVVIPDRRNNKGTIERPTTIWKARIVGADDEKLNKVYQYLVDRKWTPVKAVASTKVEVDSVAKQILE